MAGPGDALDLDRVGHELLAHALRKCANASYTGALRVAGDPGGTLHLRDGLVIGAESPGAPGPEALLLRSGRVGSEDWDALVRESEGARWPARALVEGGYAGAAQLRVVCVMALHDAVFALFAGRVHGCERVAGLEPGAVVEPGEAPWRLLEDAERRISALAALPCAVHPDRERPAPVPGAVAAPGLRRELLSRADGRSTARDLAFRSGRGVYTVTVEMARMLAEGLLECPEAPAPLPVVRPLPEGEAVRPREPEPPQPAPPAPAELPRRRPGGFFRLRNGASA